MEIDKLKKRSRQGAYLSLGGFLIVLIAFSFAAVGLSNLSEQIDKKNSTLDSLQVEIDQMDSLILSKEQDIKKKEHQIEVLLDDINRLTDPTIVPRSDAVLVPDVFHNGNQDRPIYDFTLWIYSSNITLDKIEKVEYSFDHSTFILKTRVGEKRTNNFLVSYRGWGCLQRIDVLIYYKNGEIEEQQFNMCDDLARS